MQPEIKELYLFSEIPEKPTMETAGLFLHLDKYRIICLF
jgi:hypothetical protein